MTNREQAHVPGVDIPTFRELVIAQQEKRINRLENKFVERMEDSLVKWRPSVSSHKGTIMAIDGIHPYQLQSETNTYSNIIRIDKIKQPHPNNLNAGGEPHSRDGIIDNFINWLHHMGLHNTSETMEQKVKIQLIKNNTFDEDGMSFVLPSVTDNTTLTPLVLPRSSGYNNRQENDYTGELTKGRPTEGVERNLYQFYYDNPIPVNYLDSIRHYNDENVENTERGTNNQEMPRSMTSIPNNDMSICDSCISSTFFQCFVSETISNSV